MGNEKSHIRYLLRFLSAKSEINSIKKIYVIKRLLIRFLRNLKYILDAMQFLKTDNSQERENAQGQVIIN